jgi:undecaprenyl-diphosphatase
MLSGLVHSAIPATPLSTLLPRRRLLFGLAAVLALLAMSAALSGGSVLLTWDEPIQRGVEARRTSALNDVFLNISRLGSTIPVLLLGTVASIVTWRRCRAVGMAVLIATFSRPALEFVMKAVVDRDRPDFERLVAGNGPSFPSGHVMAAVALWGLMPLVVSLYTRRRAIWWGSVAIAGTIIVAIAASRVYLGVHWFSDVTGGLIVGAFFLLGVEAVLIRQHGRYPCPFAGGGNGDPPGGSGQVEHRRHR